MQRPIIFGKHRFTPNRNSTLTASPDKSKRSIKSPSLIKSPVVSHRSSGRRSNDDLFERLAAKGNGNHEQTLRAREARK